MTLKGIDVSNWQGSSFNWEAQHAEGVDFAFIKASQGTTYVDPDFARNWRVSKERGLVRGAYHYLQPEQNIEHQAAFFLQIVHGQGLEPGDLLAVDYEVTGGLAAGEAAAAVKRFVDIVNSATNASTVVYTTRGFCQGGFCDGLGSSPLWLAAPGENNPPPPAPWHLISFVQTGQRYLDHDLGRFLTNDQLRKLGVPEPAKKAEAGVPAPRAAAEDGSSEASSTSPSAGSEPPGPTSPAPSSGAEAAGPPPPDAPSAAATAGPGTATDPAPTSAIAPTVLASWSAEHLSKAAQLLAEAEAQADKLDDSHAARIMEGMVHALIGIGTALHLL